MGTPSSHKAHNSRRRAATGVNLASFPAFKAQRISIMFFPLQR